MAHCTWREATEHVGRESDDPDAVVCIVWWVAIALAAVWTAGLYYLICWIF